MKKAITIQDIAEQLGLSRNTVSKALNGGYVPKKTRELVLEKARELNYKSMNQNVIEKQNVKSYRFLLLSGKPLNNINFFIPIIKGIENYCYKNTYQLMQFIFNSEQSDYNVLTNYITSLNVDGIIAIETFERELITKLLGLNIPISFIDFTSNSISYKGNFDILETNSREPIYQITRVLIKKFGLERFCFVGDYTHCLSFQNRYVGMLQALMLANIKHSKSDDILRSDNFVYGNPQAIASEILKLKVKPQCYICSNDFIARSVVNALKLLNMNVPNDAFVVGYDDAIDSISTSPTITTIGMNKEFLGEEAVKVLVDRVANPDTPTRTITIDSTIIPRESTKKNNK